MLPLISSSCLLQWLWCSYSRVDSCKNCYTTQNESLSRLFHNIFTSLNFPLLIDPAYLLLNNLQNGSKTFNYSPLSTKEILNLTFSVLFVLFFLILFFKFYHPADLVYILWWNRHSALLNKYQIISSQLNASFSFRLNFFPFLLLNSIQMEVYLTTYFLALYASRWHASSAQSINMFFTGNKNWVL